MQFMECKFGETEPRSVPHSVSCQSAHIRKLVSLHSSVTLLFFSFTLLQFPLYRIAISRTIDTAAPCTFDIFIRQNGKSRKTTNGSNIGVLLIVHILGIICIEHIGPVSKNNSWIQLITVLLISSKLGQFVSINYSQSIVLFNTPDHWGLLMNIKNGLLCIVNCDFCVL